MHSSSPFGCRNWSGGFSVRADSIQQWYRSIAARKGKADQAPPKPGRPPQGNVKCQVVLEPEIVQWAKYHPEGISGMLRRLMRDEYERQCHAHGDPGEP